MWRFKKNVKEVLTAINIIEWMFAVSINDFELSALPFVLLIWGVTFTTSYLLVNH